MIRFDDPVLIENIAQTIYCDAYTQYGTNTPDRWRMVSEHHRHFCRTQAVAALLVIEQVLHLTGLLANPTVMEDVARAIYSDPSTLPGTCTPNRWRAISETQRQFCRSQAVAVLKTIEQAINGGLNETA